MQKRVFGVENVGVEVGAVGQENIAVDMLVLVQKLLYKLVGDVVEELDWAIKILNALDKFKSI